MRGLKRIILKTSPLKTKIPPKNTKIPPLFFPQKIQKFPTVFPLKIYKKDPKNYKKAPKNDNLAFIFIF
jgi:hypothetical protein